MWQSKIISTCDICKRERAICTEEVLITTEKVEKTEFWCKKCKEKMIEEHYKIEEELMCEVYDDIIKSSH